MSLPDETHSVHLELVFGTVNYRLFYCRRLNIPKKRDFCMEKGVGWGGVWGGGHSTKPFFPIVFFFSYRSFCMFLSYGSETLVQLLIWKCSFFQTKQNKTKQTKQRPQLTTRSLVFHVNILVILASGHVQEALVEVRLSI